VCVVHESCSRHRTEQVQGCCERQLINPWRKRNFFLNFESARV